MLTDEQRKYILNQHLMNIFHISNKEYQRRVWVRGEGPECDDFCETGCHFFDDGDPILEQYREYGITEEQYALLNKLRDEFDVFGDSPKRTGLERDFIDTPEWDKVREAAKDVLEAFDFNEKLVWSEMKAHLAKSNAERNRTQQK